jgi:hypothetical protein
MAGMARDGTRVVDRDDIALDRQLDTQCSWYSEADETGRERQLVARSTRCRRPAHRWVRWAGQEPSPEGGSSGTRLAVNAIVS